MQIWAGATNRLVLLQFTFRSHVFTGVVPLTSCCSTILQVTDTGAVRCDVFLFSSVSFLSIASSSSMLSSPYKTKHSKPIVPRSIVQLFPYRFHVIVVALGTHAETSAATVAAKTETTEAAATETTGEERAQQQELSKEKKHK